METNDILETLSEEEKKLLSKIENRIKEKFDAAREAKFDELNQDQPLDFSQKHPEVIEPVHIGKNPHEIRVSMTIEISEVDEKGYLKETKEMIKKNYHIPVPAQKDYNTYVQKFTSRFQQKLTETCQETFTKQEYDG
jgi:hypothetical protein